MKKGHNLTKSLLAETPELLIFAPPVEKWEYYLKWPNKCGA